MSSFDLKYDFSEEMNGYVLEDSRLNNSNKGVKLYIPTVMNGIQKGEPTLSVLKTSGKGVFCNSGRLPITTSQVLREQNYLESDMNTSSIVNDLESTVRSLTKDKSSLSYTIKKDSIVRTQFLNNKVSKLSFKTTKESNTEINVEDI